MRYIKLYSIQGWRAKDYSFYEVVQMCWVILIVLLVNVSGLLDACVSHLEGGRVNRWQANLMQTNAELKLITQTKN